MENPHKEGRIGSGKTEKDGLEMVSLEIETVSSMNPLR